MLPKLLNQLFIRLSLSGELPDRVVKGLVYHCSRWVIVEFLGCILANFLDHNVDLIALISDHLLVSMILQLEIIEVRLERIEVAVLFPLFEHLFQVVGVDLINLLNMVFFLGLHFFHE